MTISRNDSLRDRRSCPTAPPGSMTTRRSSRVCRRANPTPTKRSCASHGGRLLSVARRFLRNNEDAQDAVQEAFIKAFRAIGTFEERAQLHTWLHRILVNTALMKIRSRRRRPEESIDDLLPTFLGRWPPDDGVA